jgi:threonyl-tRNA synthetase
MEKENKKPMLPIWVSPVQVRIIPTDNNFIDYCNNISEQFIKFGFRVDIDDTELKFNKKIRNAEKEWIPYVIVIGEKEIKSGNISLRIRNGNQIVTTINRFIEELESKLKEYPKISQHLPVFVSKQININSL